VLKSILATTLFAGILDIIAACLHAYLSKGISPDRVLAYIASGVFGKAAYSGGFGMMAWGLFFHFTIVLFCAAIYFLLYPRLSMLPPNIALRAVLIAVVAWLVTTQVVIRLSRIPPPPFHWANALIAIGILVLCIGLPIAYSAKRFY
jgi:hypothetical protein